MRSRARRAFKTSATSIAVKVPTGPSWISYMWSKSGPFGYYNIAFGRGQTLRVEIYLDASKEVNKALFDEFFAERQRWESLIGFSLTWERMDDAKASRIYAQREFDLTNSEDETYTEALQWAANCVKSIVSHFDQDLRWRATKLNHELVAD